MKFDLINKSSKAQGMRERLISITTAKRGDKQALRISMAQGLLEQASLAIGDFVSLHGDDEGKLTLRRNDLGWRLYQGNKARPGYEARVIAMIPAPDAVVALVAGKPTTSVSANKTKQTVSFKVA